MTLALFERWITDHVCVIPDARLVWTGVAVAMLLLCIALALWTVDHESITENAENTEEDLDDGND